MRKFVAGIPHFFYPPPNSTILLDDCVAALGKCAHILNGMHRYFPSWLLVLKQDGTVGTYSSEQILK